MRLLTVCYEEKESPPATAARLNECEMDVLIAQFYVTVCEVSEKPFVQSHLICMEHKSFTLSKTLHVCVHMYTHTD